MIIVKPIPENYPAIAAIFNQAIMPFYAIYMDEEKDAFTLQEDVDSITDLAHSRDILCAQDIDGMITAYAAFRKKNQDVVWISGLYVLPLYQGRGIGLSLLRAIENKAQAWGCKIVALETHEKADWAINFYKRAGYDVINGKITEPGYAAVLQQPPVGRRPVLAKWING